MRDLSQETWTADSGGNVDSHGNVAILVYNERGQIVATAYGRTLKEARIIAEAIALLPDTFDPPYEDE